MKLSKQNVCVFIENEAQLQQAKELLEKHGEEIAEDGTFELSSKEANYLNLYIDDKWFLGWKHEYFNQIKLSELDTFLKNESK